MSPMFRYAMVVICILAAGFWLGVGISFKLGLALGVGLVFAALAFVNLYFSGEGE